MQRLSTSKVITSSADWLAAKAIEIGFDLCGVIPASDLAPPEHFAEWLESGFAGEMRYLHDPRRADPAAVLPEARSAIVCAVNYNPAAPYSTEAAAQSVLENDPKGWISRYAWGDDYHIVVGEMLEQFVAALRSQFGAQCAESFAARAYVDTGPISERMAAKLAGLGWLGKNTCLINRDIGSWLFLGVILTSLDLCSHAAPRTPAADLCGQCRLCLDACPTGAIVEPYVLDARRCISYLTIELRSGIPEELRAAMGWQIFGCDICQDVCPWNRGAPATSLPSLARPGEQFEIAAKPEKREKRKKLEKLEKPEKSSKLGKLEKPQNSEEPAKLGKSDSAQRNWLESPDLLWLLSLSEDEFRAGFRHSAARRAQWRGLIRNACVAAGNALRQQQGHPRSRAALRDRLAQLAESNDVLLAEHARWALAQGSPALESP